MLRWIRKSAVKLHPMLFFYVNGNKIHPKVLYWFFICTGLLCAMGCPINYPPLLFISSLIDFLFELAFENFYANWVLKFLILLINRVMYGYFVKNCDFLQVNLHVNYTQYFTCPISLPFNSPLSMIPTPSFFVHPLPILLPFISLYAYFSLVFSFFISVHASFSLLLSSVWLLFLTHGLDINLCVCSWLHFWSLPVLFYDYNSCGL